MIYEALTDEKGELLYGVLVKHDSGFTETFTTMDIAYTLSQTYKEVLVGDLCYINSKFPKECLTFEVNEDDLDIPTTMRNLDVDMYFNGDGVFMFRGQDEPNITRAVDEFVTFLRAGAVIKGPMCASFTATADNVIIKKLPDGMYSVYMYQD